MDIKRLQWSVGLREFQWTETPQHTVELSIEDQVVEFQSKHEVDQLMHAWQLMTSNAGDVKESPQTIAHQDLSGAPQSKPKDPTAFPRKIRYTVIGMVILCICILAYDVLLT